MKISYLSLIFISLLITLSAFSAQRAVVRSEKAVIYAEIERVTPIGFVTKGKVVTVGDIARGPYRMLPIVVSGRLCHIQQADLFINEFDTKNTHKPTAALINTSTSETSNDQAVMFKKTRSVEISYQTFSAGNEWNQNYRDSFGVDANPAVTNFSSRYFFKKLSGFNTGIGLDLYSLSQEKATASVLAASFEINRVLWENNYFEFKPSLSLLSGFNLKNYGYKINAPLSYHLTRSFDFKVGLGYQNIYLTSLDIGGVKKDLQWSGLNMLASLEYYF